MMVLFAILFSVVSTVWISVVCGGVPGSHYTDFTPDYPGGSLGFGWLISNVVVWGIVAGLS